VSGTVRLEPSGWGTRVTLTAETAVVEEPVVIEPEVVVEPVAEEVPTEDVASDDVAGEEPPAEAEPSPPRRRLLDRLRAFFTGPEPPTADPELDDSAESPSVEAIAEPVAVEPEPEPEPEGEPVDAEPPGLDPDAVLTAALDSLGQAHHRPFSRA
jgi:hypothetical protein